jgi:hypothetical protein
MEPVLQLTTQGLLIHPYSQMRSRLSRQFKTSAASVDAIVALELEADARVWIRANDLSVPNGGRGPHCSARARPVRAANGTAPWRWRRVLR